MKKIFVYYSETGNGDSVASLFKDAGYEILKLEMKKKLPKVLFFKMMVGGFKALRNKHTPALPYNFNKNDCDLVVVGTPIWNGRFTPIMNTFIQDNDLVDYSLVVYSGGGEAAKTKEKMLSDSKYHIAHYIDLREPKKNVDEAKQKLEELLRIK